MVNPGDFDSDDSPNIARTNSFNIFSNHGYNPPSLLEINRKLDMILKYIGYDRKIPVPASGEYADLYYDKEEKKRRLNLEQQHHDKQKPSKITKERITNTSLRYIIGEKIDQISHYVGASNQVEYSIKSCESNKPIMNYRYKRGMSRWVYEW